jgi:hypothetical protein
MIYLLRAFVEVFSAFPRSSPIFALMIAVVRPNVNARH